MLTEDAPTASPATRSADAEGEDVEGERHDHRADEVEGVAEEDDALAAVAVAGGASEHGAREGAEGRDADDEALGPRTGAELLADEEERAADDAGVVAEEETAETAEERDLAEGAGVGEDARAGGAGAGTASGGLGAVDRLVMHLGVVVLDPRGAHAEAHRLFGAVVPPVRVGRGCRVRTGASAAPGRRLRGGERSGGRRRRFRDAEVGTGRGCYGRGRARAAYHDEGETHVRARDARDRR